MTRSAWPEVSAPTLAVDIGGSKTAAGLVSPDGVVTARVTTATPAQEGAEAIIGAVLGLAEGLVADEAVAEVGIASAGIVEPGTGRISHATDLLRGWAGTPLGDLVRRAVGLPVAVLNDVHAHGLGESIGGAATGFRSALVVAVGTGIGGCHVVDGRPQLGARGVAGHVGHLPVAEAEGVPCSCGRTGHLEGLASGSGVRAAFLGRTGRDLPAVEIAALAAGVEDADAVAVLTDAGRATGRVVGGLLNVLDPEVVVLGGGMAAAGAAWQQALADGVALEAMDAAAGTPLRYSTAGTDAALVGAAHHARTVLRTHGGRP